MKQNTETSTLTALVPAECGEKKVSAPQKMRYVIDTDDDDDDDDDGEEWFLHSTVSSLICMSCASSFLFCEVSTRPARSTLRPSL